MERPDYPPTIRLADIATHASSRQSSTSQRRIRVLLNVAGNQIMRGHTLHVGVDQLTVSVPMEIQRDQECAIFFGLTIEDQIFSIIGTGRVIVCSGNDKDGFRAEMTFSVADKKSRMAIVQLFGGQGSNRVQ